MSSGEPDFTKRIKGQMDLAFVKGVALKDPTVTGCVPVSIEHVVDINHLKIKGTTLKNPSFTACIPCSIENTAIAYDITNDRFKVVVESWTAGALAVSLANDFTRQLGQVDLYRVLGATLAHTNPVIVRLSTGATWLDPRDRNWTITEALARSWNLGASDVPDLSDRAARLLGKVYGNQDVLQQRATTKELLVQIQHQGVEKDPTQIRALTSSDVITVVQGTAANLLATVTQAAKDRTISSVDATATAQQIDVTFSGSGNQTVRTPAGGKKIRLKFLSLELSADVVLGYRFAAAGTIFYLRTTKGPYLSNLIGANNEGAADEALILNASAACTVKGYALVQEL
jgi:hypothetical protein